MLREEDAGPQRLHLRLFKGKLLVVATGCKRMKPQTEGGVGGNKRWPSGRHNVRVGGVCGG